MNRLVKPTQITYLLFQTIPPLHTHLLMDDYDGLRSEQWADHSALVHLGERWLRRRPVLCQLCELLRQGGVLQHMQPRCLQLRRLSCSHSPSGLLHPCRPVPGGSQLTLLIVPSATTKDYPVHQRTLWLLYLV